MTKSVLRFLKQDLEDWIGSTGDGALRDIDQPLGSQRTVIMGPAYRSERRCSSGSGVVALKPAEMTPETLRFALDVKRDALGPYIVERWGWDEEMQQRNMLERWARTERYTIYCEDRAVGIVSIQATANSVCIEELYVLPGFQRRGIGGEVVHMVLAAAADARLPVTLQCLKWNDGAIRFYQRHGFAVTGETQTHVTMKADAA